jgi:hypothetical protein
MPGMIILTLQKNTITETIISISHYDIEGVNILIISYKILYKKKYVRRLYDVRTYYIM